MTRGVSLFESPVRGFSRVGLIMVSGMLKTFLCVLCDPAVKPFGKHPFSSYMSNNHAGI
jgi:hypothetical protein